MHGFTVLNAALARKSLRDHACANIFGLALTLFWHRGHISKNSPLLAGYHNWNIVHSVQRLDGEGRGKGGVWMGMGGFVMWGGCGRGTGGGGGERSGGGWGVVAVWGCAGVK